MKYLLFFLLAFTASAVLCAQELHCKTSINYGNNAAAGNYVRINNIQMYYETYGDPKKQPLLLIHGNGGSVGSGGCQIEYFKEDYFVIIADSRHQGKSGNGKQELTYRLMANDYYQLLNYLQLDSVHIIGQSDGAIIGLLLAIEYPAKVKKLVASAPNLRPDSTALYQWNIDDVQRDLQKVNAKINKGDTSLQTTREKVLFELMLKHPHITIEELHTIYAPVLLVFGDADYMPFSHVMEIYNNLPKANLLIMPGAGHRSYRLEPELFNAFCQRFFDHPFQKPTARDGY